MNFEAGVRAWTSKAAGQFEKLRRAVIIELFSSVILDTPVDTGRLRGNWVISNGAPDSGTVEILDPSGSVSIASVSALAAGLPAGKDTKTFLTNSLPYAYEIEYEGASRKAPSGMVRKNMLRISANLKR